MLNRKILIGLLLVATLSLSFASDAEARHRRFGRGGFGGGRAVAAVLGAGLLANSFNNCGPYGGFGGYGYAPVGFGGYGYAPVGFGGYGYAPYAYDPYGYGYGAGFGGYGYPGYGFRRRRSNIVPALIGGALLYSAFRR